MELFNSDGKRLANKYERIRILEYNVGNFDDGGTSGYSGNDLDGYIAEWATFIGKQSADICMFSESRKRIDSNNTVTAESGLYSPLFNEVLTYNPSETWGIALLSQEGQSSTQTGQFTNQSSSQSKYAGALITINGIDVYVMAVHLIHGGSATQTVRAAQMAEIVSMVSTYDNVILGGDFNTHDLSTELATLTNAGFTFANGGIWGTHSTFVTDPDAPLDNVGIKGDKLKLISYEVLTDQLSDHYPTITEILVG